MLENRKTVEIKRIDMCKERYKEGGNNWFFYFFFFFLGLDYLQFFADFQKSFQITFNCMSILSNFLSGVTAAVKRRNFEIDIYVIETWYHWSKPHPRPNFVFFYLKNAMEWWKFGDC